MKHLVEFADSQTEDDSYTLDEALEGKKIWEIIKDYLGYLDLPYEPEFLRIYNAIEKCFNGERNFGIFIKKRRGFSLPFEDQVIRIYWIIFLTTYIIVVYTKKM